jgi:DNA-binding CsgD family transcriptional regulator
MSRPRLVQCSTLARHDQIANSQAGTCWGQCVFQRYAYVIPTTTVIRSTVLQLRRTSLVLEGTLIGLAVGIVVAAGVGWVLEARLADVLVRELSARAADHLQLGIVDHVTALDFAPPHTPAKLQDLRTRVGPTFDRLSHDGSGVASRDLLGPDGARVYSDQPGQTGRRVSDSELSLLGEALRGRVSSGFESPAAAHDAIMPSLFGGAYTVYVPVVLDGSVVGAYRLDEDVSLVRSAQAPVWALVVGAFGIFSNLAARALLVRSRSAARPHAAAAAPATSRSARAVRPNLAYGQHLTPREQEVLAQLSSCHSYAEIAARLGISGETVRTHVKSILHKLGQPDRTQAVVYALQMGILTMSEQSATMTNGAHRGGQ